MKKILITGANGFLGQHLTFLLSKDAYSVVATGRGHCRISLKNEIIYTATDLTDKEAIKSLLFKFKPEVIIHNAALSKPDECDTNRDICLKVNVEATKHLLQSTAEHFIYISTDFIFGENGPHEENAEPGPLNFYGQSKLLAEQLVKESGKKTTIVRPVFIYGKVWEGMRRGFLQWVKNNLEQGKSIKVVSDQLRTPTYVTDICKGIEKIISKQATGVYHLAGKDILSPYEMAVKTAQALHLNESLIEKVTAETFPEPVKRAKRSGLLITKAQRDLDYEPVSLNEGIRLTFDL